MTECERHLRVSRDQRLVVLLPVVPLPVVLPVPVDELLVSPLVEPVPPAVPLVPVSVELVDDDGLDGVTDEVLDEGLDEPLIPVVLEVSLLPVVVLELEGVEEEFDPLVAARSLQPATASSDAAITARRILLCTVKPFRKLEEINAYSIDAEIIGPASQRVQ